jgi:hypothetical protein
MTANHLLEFWPGALVGALAGLAVVVVAHVRRTR